MMNLNYVQPVLPDAFQIPDGNNGGAMHIVVDSTQAFIKPTQKIAIMNGGFIDIHTTIQCLAHTVMVNNTDAITQPEFEMCCNEVIQHALRYKILNSLVNCGVGIAYRAADVYSPAELLIKADNAHDHIIEAAKLIYRWSTTTALDMIESLGRNGIICVIANALHRKLDDGHNWKTGNASDKKSITFKCAGVKADDRLGFTRFMDSFGHDLFHCVTTICLNTVALALVGEVGHRHVVTGPCFNTPYIALQADVYLDSIVRLPSSAVDRYPTNTLGLASMMIAIPLCISMAEAMYEKDAMNDLQLTALRVYYTGFMAYLKAQSKTISRTTLLNLRTGLAGIAAAAIGFAERYVRYEVEEHLSLNNFLQTMSGERQKGSRLALALKNKVVTDEIVLNRIIGQFVTVPTLVYPAIGIN